MFLKVAMGEPLWVTTKAGFSTLLCARLWTWHFELLSLLMPGTMSVPMVHWGWPPHEDLGVLPIAPPRLQWSLLTPAWASFPWGPQELPHLLPAPCTDCSRRSMKTEWGCLTSLPSTLEMEGEGLGPGAQDCSLGHGNGRAWGSGPPRARTPSPSLIGSCRREGANQNQHLWGGWIWTIWKSRMSVSHAATHNLPQETPQGVLILLNWPNSPSCLDSGVFAISLPKSPPLGPSLTTDLAPPVGPRRSG
jgi:hypothetical protein